MEIMLSHLGVGVAYDALDGLNPHQSQLLAGSWRDRGAGCYHWG